MEENLNNNKNGRNPQKKMVEDLTKKGGRPKEIEWKTNQSTILAVTPL
jgi:hypothetical protein